MSCIFCDISNGKINANIVYQDDLMIIFKDINPVAPIHLLAIPRAHIQSAADVNSGNSQVIAHIFQKVSELKDELNLNDGCRIVSNCGENAGQTVKHLHFHILSGKKLGWPPV